MRPITNKDGKIYWKNGSFIGDIYPEVDGYYVWVPPEPFLGCWESHVLRHIADYLDEINKPWHDEVCQYFESLRGNDNA